MLFAEFTFRVPYVKDSDLTEDEKYIKQITSNMDDDDFIEIAYDLSKGSIRIDQIAAYYQLKEKETTCTVIELLNGSRHEVLQDIQTITHLILTNGRHL